jgi:serine/threonine-protein kinase
MIGTSIEHYQIIERLGQGGMGAVYRATDTLLEREVALKLLRPEYAADPAFAERIPTSPRSSDSSRTAHSSAW